MPGSSTVSGLSDPSCVGGVVTIFDCDVVEHPPVCYNGNDVSIGSGTKVNGHFNITVSPPLQPGQIIYATDGCSDPVLVGPSVVIEAPSPAPLVSPIGLVGLVGLLALVGVFGLWRAVPRRL